jgi:hypothetical protein
VHTEVHASRDKESEAVTKGVKEEEESEDASNCGWRLAVWIGLGWC